MTDERYKQIMNDLGMPNNRFLLAELQQVAYESWQQAMKTCASICDKYDEQATYMAAQDIRAKLEPEVSQSGGIMLKGICAKCGYEWEPRVESPVECPNCKSRRWEEIIKRMAVREKEM